MFSPGGLPYLVETNIREVLYVFQPVMRLLFPFIELDDRKARWRRHVEVFTQLENCKTRFGPSTKADAVVSGIKFIAGHLQVLDAKFASLLQFQALLAVAAGLLLRIGEQKIQPLSLEGLAWLAPLWFATTFFCLVGANWFIWGELQPPHQDQNLSSLDRGVKAAEDHLDKMITVVINRTTLFRIAWLLTFVSVLLLHYFVVPGFVVPVLWNVLST
ncbi:hypothetical protein [Desulfomonile tiedjei]|uniref:Uncharacterized protein n=1 Tax=Desulfomonile tiedjei (strain ATCC 49306 / DSM 6799 / DCB-1) TaxID=706587 RepID=I4C5K5_DESTA|nr:hypothetical protein [Desulfomonile tiedjei]AFM24846.1 hypothetical protein Desti_2148 [Desulfomonile tiedjei DSM 6799]